MTLLEAAKNLRTAQRAYMKARNSDPAQPTWRETRSPLLDVLGKAVADAGRELDAAIEEAS